MKDELLPAQRIDSNHPELPKFSIIMSPETPTSSPGDSNNNTRGSVSPPTNKRKFNDVNSPVFPAKRPSLDSPGAKRPNSLTLSLPSPTTQYMKSPGKYKLGLVSVTKNIYCFFKLLDHFFPKCVHTLCIFEDCTIMLSADCDLDDVVC